MPSRFVLVLALLGVSVGVSVGVSGCGILDTEPTDQLPNDLAITDARSARAALAGAYNALQSLSYYGSDMLVYNELSSDNAVATGSFTSYHDADENRIRADDPSVQFMWGALYDGINRVNNILELVPAVTDLDDTEKNEILGEAHFLRALHHHNLVKLWGDVPIRTETVTDVDDASKFTRSTVADVYDQIIDDLTAAETLITNTSPTTQATTGAVEALFARVYLYQGDWTNALAKANLVEGMGYELAGTFGDLFDAQGIATPEDIFKVLFTAQQDQFLGYYYISEDEGGNGQAGPSQSLIDAFPPADVRLAWSIHGTEESSAWGTKFPTTAGAEDVHVIRFAEVLLIKAEAQARLDLLEDAVDTYNLLRVRAGIPEDEFGLDVATQGEVLAAIDLERRRELAFEGDRWPDLVRQGRAETVLGIPAFRTLYPIPQSEREVAPGITQNPGY